MTKCDHPDCFNKAVYYGWHQSYCVCMDHVPWGNAFEIVLLEEQQEILITGGQA